MSLQEDGIVVVVMSLWCLLCYVGVEELGTK